jgi:hypothetical protein
VNVCGGPAVLVYRLGPNVGAVAALADAPTLSVNAMVSGTVKKRSLKITVTNLFFLINISSLFPVLIA